MKTPKMLASHDVLWCKSTCSEAEEDEEGLQIWCKRQEWKGVMMARGEGASGVWGNRKCETAEELIKQARSCSSSVQLFLLVCLDDNI
jgi:hypothetical protein